MENRGVITTELQVETAPPRVRQTAVLRLVGIAPSSWHRLPRDGERKRPPISTIQQLEYRTQVVYIIGLTIDFSVDLRMISC
jgi:hypothetical protein